MFQLNILLAHDILNLASPVAVQQVLNIQSLPDRYLTRGKEIKLLKRPFVRTTKYGINSMRYQIVLNWNNIVQQNRLDPFLSMSKNYTPIRDFDFP